MTFTRTQDVSLFVVAALGLEKWEEMGMGMVGDEHTFYEVVEVAERATGRKLLVKTNSTAVGQSD